MSEKYFRVGAHGPPNPGEHPWVMVRQAVGPVGPKWQIRSANYVETWDPSIEWFPVEAPPSELAPEPEDQGVEVDGRRYRINADGFLQAHTQFGWVLSEYREVLADELAQLAHVAQALGLVDQPSVPQALIEWLHRWVEDEPVGSQNRMMDLGVLLDMIEAGEFGPVEPTDAAEGER